MKYKTTQDSFTTILKIVLGVVLGVILLAISYKAVTTSREIRSKAAGLQDVTYKSWEFNGATTEGWIQTNLTGLKVASGLLTAFTTNYNAILSNKSVATAMPVGNKYLKFRLAVLNLPQPTSKPIASAAIVSTTPSPQPQTFTIGLSYMIRGALQQKVLPVIPGTAFGNMYEYSVRLPDIGGITIDSIQMILKPMRVGMSIRLDWVRLAGPPPPTPTPSPPVPTPKPTGCYTGLQSYAPIKPEACASGYSVGIKYICWDGYTGYINQGTVCYSIEDMKAKATLNCTGRSNCPTPTRINITPTPTPGPPTVIPYPSPTP